MYSVYYWPCVDVVALEVVEREDRVGDDHYSDEVVEEGEWQEHVREGGHAARAHELITSSEFSHQGACATSHVVYMLKLVCGVEMARAAISLPGVDAIHILWPNKKVYMNM